MEEMKFYTQEEMLDKVIGIKGTSARDQYEEEVQSLLIDAQISKTEPSDQFIP